MNLKQMLTDEFAEDFNRCFLNSVETLENTIQSVLDDFSFNIGMDINDLFLFQDGFNLLTKLKSEMYSSRISRKHRILQEIKKQAPRLSKKYGKSEDEIIAEVESLQIHPINNFFVRIPYFADSLTQRIAYNSFVSDVTLCAYIFSINQIEYNHANIFTIPHNVHDIVSISNKTPIVPMESQAMRIMTSTTNLEYPSSKFFYESIEESKLSDYKEEAIKKAFQGYFNSTDLKVFGAICSKAKIGIFNNDFSVKVSLKDLVNVVHDDYRKEYEKKIIYSLIKLSLVKIFKNGLIMGFLTNLSYTTDGKENYITTNLDSFMADQIKANHSIQLDTNIYKIVTNDMAQALILPMQTYRFKSYLSNKNRNISDNFLKIDWIWVSKHLSVPTNSRPSIIMDRIQIALTEFINKNVLIDRYVKQKNTFIVYLKNISPSEEDFIEKHYIEKDILLGDSEFQLSSLYKSIL